MGSYYADKIKKGDGSRSSSPASSSFHDEFDSIINLPPKKRVQRELEIPPHIPLFSERFPNAGLPLSVSHPDSPQEKAADAVADKVVSSPVPESAEKSSSMDKVQRETSAGSGAGSTALDPGTAGEIQGLRGKGTPLSDETRSFMESRMGGDFGDVRVHTGTQAEELSDRLQAKAFTYGNDIVFNKGEYSPGTGEGKRLLAHELAHTVQQDSDRIHRFPELTIYWLENRTDHTIYVKPEHDNTPVAVPPGEAYDDRWDGVATHYSKDYVYKVPDFGRGFVDPDGSVRATYYVSGIRFFSDNYGWKDIDFFHNLKPADHNWDLLFDAAKSIS